MSKEVKNLNPPVLAGFGNPLLDMSVQLRNNSFYDKFSLETDGQREINASDLMCIISYFSKRNSGFKYCAGGSAQNTLRVFQWLMKKPYYSVFFGGIGVDEQGELLENEVAKAGVCTRYIKHEDHSTGTCVAIINGTERCLVAHLGAANEYSVKDFNVPENIKLFNTLFIAYIEGFFISHSFETALEVIKLCKLSGVALAFNLSSPYLFDNYYKEILQIVKSADILIGNATEMKEFWKHYRGDSTDIKEIISDIQFSVLINEENTSDKKPLKIPILETTKKIVICTQSQDNVLCVYGNKEYLEVSPPAINKSLIIDTTGAGDAFVAGFFSGVLSDKALKESIELGCWAAGEIIQRIGCSVPSE